MPHRNRPNSKDPAQSRSASHTDAKSESLESFRTRAEGEALRTNQGVKIADNQNSLRAGPRGPSLLEDFIMREKITHFDHERIPERIVHARGSAAHGVFRSTNRKPISCAQAFCRTPRS